MFTRKLRADNLKKLVISILVAVFVITLTQNIIFSFKPINDLESKLIDSRFRQRGPVFIHDSTEVIIIEISQETYDQIPTPYNSWPWPRSLFAKLIQNLSDAGAKAIGIDLMMTDQDRYSPANDSLLMREIRNNGNVVVAGKLDVNREAILSDYGDYELQNIERRPEAFVRYLNERYGNIFFDADSSIGIAQIPLDNDGIARRYYPFVYSGITEKYIPTFSLAVLNKYFNLESDYIAENKNGVFEFSGRELPKYDNSSVLINFYGYNRSFPHYKFIDIVDDKDYQTKDELELGVQ
jgi:adenylate cyclase